MFFIESFSKNYTYYTPIFLCNVFLCYVYSVVLFLSMCVVQWKLLFFVYYFCVVFSCVNGCVIGIYVCFRKPCIVCKVF